MARPRQRHRCADDLARRPRYPAGADAEAGFYEEYHQERQDFGAAVNASQWHYPMSETRAALQRLSAADSGEAGEGIILEYTTGSPADR
jgi:hypothetical protein